jgi:CRP-like cAMP-binding protein
MASGEDEHCNVAEALTRMELRKANLRLKRNETIYSQGDDASNVYYLEQGRVKITIVSRSREEAVVALVGESKFVGEGCLTAQRFRLSTANALPDCTVVSIDKDVIKQAMHTD